ncbi:centromere protein H (CENP-H)-domain-containing protein [Colletotrichum lupini]|nr:centromere protein H (CENP-H)-domain-containing protein [Colletotrichum lupini]
MDELPNRSLSTANKADQVPTLLLSNDEQRVLALYDELRDLEIKVALVKAQQSHVSGSTTPSTEENVRKAQQDASTARAGWLLRNNITDSVMTASPILKVVHGSTQSTPIETDLLPHIRSRDNVSVALANKSEDIRSLIKQLTEVEAESLRVGRKNVELTAEILRLTEDAEKRNAGETDDPAVQAEIARLEAEMKASIRRWKVMKGTASAVVVGSGVDWSRDEALREVVLDPEDDE